MALTVIETLRLSRSRGFEKYQTQDYQNDHHPKAARAKLSTEAETYPGLLRRYCLSVIHIDSPPRSIFLGHLLPAHHSKVRTTVAPLFWNLSYSFKHFLPP